MSCEDCDCYANGECAQICPECQTCAPPGGQGLFRPAPLYSPRPMRVGDHGEFASWETGLICGARVFSINPDNTVNLWADFPDGNGMAKYFTLPVAQGEGQWDDYLTHRKIYHKMREKALRAALDEFKSHGGVLQPQMVWDGHYVRPFHYAHVDCRGMVLRSADAAVSLHVLFSRGGWKFAENVPVFGDSKMEMFLKYRSVWVPIREKYIAQADAEIAAYLNGTKY